MRELRFNISSLDDSYSIVQFIPKSHPMEIALSHARDDTKLANAHNILDVSLHRHTGYVRYIAMSRDGKRILSGSADHTIRAREGVTSRTLGAPLRGHTGVVSSVVISLDGNLIVSGSYDQTNRAWDAITRKALPLQGRSLSQLQQMTNALYQVQAIRQFKCGTSNSSLSPDYSKYTHLIQSDSCSFCPLLSARSSDSHPDPRTDGL